MGTKTFPRKSSTWMNFPLTWIPLTRSWQHIKFIYNCFRDSLKFSDSLKFNLYWHFFTLWVKRWKYAFLKIWYGRFHFCLPPGVEVGYGPYKMRIRGRGCIHDLPFLLRGLCVHTIWYFEQWGDPYTFCRGSRGKLLWNSPA